MWEWVGITWAGHLELLGAEVWTGFLRVAAGALAPSLISSLSGGGGGVVVFHQGHTEVCIRIVSGHNASGCVVPGSLSWIP